MASFSTGAQGSSGTPSIPIHEPSSFSWSTSVWPHEQAIFLDVIKEQVHTREALDCIAEWQKIARLPTRSQKVEADGLQKCELCSITKAEAEISPGTCRPRHSSFTTKMSGKETCTACKRTTDDRGCVNGTGEHLFNATANSSAFVVPAADPSLSKRAFVVLDAEMIDIQYQGASVKTRFIAQLAMIDGLTGEVLINHYIVPPPSAKIISLSTKYSGITHKIISDGRKNGTAIRGLDGLHAEISRHVDENTIIGGHSLTNDLLCLQMGHGYIVDSQILYSNDPRRYKPGLKDLVKLHCDATIQAGPKGHDALEDTCATREIILVKVRAILKSRDDALKACAAAKREENR